MNVVRGNTDILLNCVAEQAKIKIHNALYFPSHRCGHETLVFLKLDTQNASYLYAGPELHLPWYP